ncbi:ABC transporter ATP-binding protein [Halobaculum halobium]|uniref:ABC transporter ATP-binding protein n=1 Tax=Halobaculum halobium TaxID=3032281 RepID=A0ABD5T7Z9_9EURY|nr:ABC transporter ATP-binding protein [Halobaculum sp. SYNS20]
MTDSTPPEDHDAVSNREKLAAIREVIEYRPSLAVGIVALSVLVGAMEGIGLGFILPIVTVLQDGGGDPSGATRLFLDAYALLGIPFTLEYIVAGVGGVLAVRYALGVCVAWLAAILNAGYRRHLRVESYDAALDARTAYFDEHGSDELLNAVLTQTSYASRAITRIVRAVKTTLVCAAYGFIAFLLAPRLMAATGVVLISFMFVSRYAFESGYGVGDRIARANERVQSVLQAGIQGIREVKLFGLESELRAEFREAVDRHTRASIRKQRDQTALANLNQFFAAATVFGLIYLGARVASLSLAGLGVFLFAMFRLAPRLSSLNGLAYDIDNDLPHLVRTRAFLARLRGDREDWGDESVDSPVERVEFRGVGFGYSTGDGTVLRDVSFAVERGEFVAFVGPSGAGKSTIASLLAGLYRPNEGDISADGVPIERFSVDEWRDRVAVVGQTPHLFNETLRYNLTVGNRDASDATVAEACRIARVTEFLDDLPDGYDTVLGDDGVRLSGGQRQRVAIARALVTDADVVVLDEATSELDSHLEAEVHAGIERLDRDYAVVGIAHRLSTVTDADAIHVMEDGAIVESGTHAELVTDEGAYADLYAAQMEQPSGATLGAGG